MSNLRAVTKQRFIEALENSYFAAANYTVTYPDDDEVEIDIEFIPRPDFQFRVSSSGGRFRTTESPGEHLVIGDSNVRDDISECIYAVTEWARRIEEEYRITNPVVDDFEAFRESIASRLKEHVADEHVHFTATEAEDLRAKLDELKDKLTSLSEKSEGFEHRLATAIAELESLKPDLEKMPRGIWYRKASGKALNAMKGLIASKEVREFALEAAKKVFLEGPK